MQVSYICQSSFPELKCTQKDISITLQMKKYSVSNFEIGMKFDFGFTVLSEEDIISFAREFDPLEFHVNKEAALKSPFKGLVASGAHIFTLVHKTYWLPLFKDTVIAGLEVNNWRFLKPLYANKKTHCSVHITDIKLNPKKKHATVSWKYEFKDEDDQLLQHLEMTILHKTD